MSSSGRTGFARVGRKKGPHHVIIARGETIRSFKLRPWLAWTVGVGGVLFLTLYVLATGYWVFRDDILAASIARQSRMRVAYEDRISELRSQIDRVTSRQLLDQEAIDAKMQQLLGRQAALDARQDLLADLEAVAKKAGVKFPAATAATDVVPTANAVAIDPLPTGALPNPGDQAATHATPLRESRLDDNDLPSSADQRLSAVEFSLNTMERQQADFVQTVAANVSATADRIETVIGRLGHKIEPESDVGGPYVPLVANPRSFRQGIAAVTDGIEHLAALRDAARQLPLWRPLPDADITSGFGTRLDPFLNRPSIHTGVDFRSPVGSVVRVTAAGTVIDAGLTGGYGNMVEVDHGNGITTRYGHLSVISVKVGEKLDAGDIVGEVGSTGRSTGPHLHYEVRVSGEPIDPMRYIQAGGQLRGVL